MYKQVPSTVKATDERLKEFEKNICYGVSARMVGIYVVDCVVWFTDDKWRFILQMFTSFPGINCEVCRWVSVLLFMSLINSIWSDYIPCVISLHISENKLFTLRFKWFWLCVINFAFNSLVHESAIIYLMKDNFLEQ